MMKTNKLTTVLSGVATLGIATAIAAPAQAIHFTVTLGPDGNGFVNTTIVNKGDGVVGLGIDVDDNPLTPLVVYDSVIIGDKSFYNFSIGGSVAFTDMLKFMLNQGNWTVQYMPLKHLGVDDGTLQYEAHIQDPNQKFALVSFDTDVSAPKIYTAIKEIFKLGGTTPILTLTSTNGNPDAGSILPFQVDTIKVIDTYTKTASSGSTLLLSSSNDFTQVAVPEPGTILGLLTVGGLGLVSRFKKQK